MGLDKKAYVLSKRYTDETAIQFGGLKGANAKIKSIVHENGQNIVTFEWKNDDGEIRESLMYVEDGTPIYTYTPGDTYHYGDLVIYQSAFYRCTVEEYVAEPIIDDTKFNEIGSPDGNYDIVQNSSLLPVRFTAADRKMYYAIEEGTFFLLNGERWVKQFIVDDELDEESENPVQNKVIKAELDKKQNKLTQGDGITIEENLETHELVISGNSMSQEELSEMWKEAGVLVLDKESTTITVGNDDTVEILDSSGLVNITVDDEDIVTATLLGTTITIVGVAEGETEVNVTCNATASKRKITKCITVTVNE